MSEEDHEWQILRIRAGLRDVSARRDELGAVDFLRKELDRCGNCTVEAIRAERTSGVWPDDDRLWLMSHVHVTGEKGNLWIEIRVQS